MNASLKTLLMFAVVTGLYGAPALAHASVGGVTGEARLHPGIQNSQPASRAMIQPRPVYRNNASTMKNSEQAEPTDARNYSYEPTQKKASEGCKHGSNAGPEKAEAKAQGSARSFSYEPSESGSSSAPRMRLQSAPKPSFLLQKADPAKYHTH